MKDIHIRKSVSQEKMLVQWDKNTVKNLLNLI